jgi:hypothetical protein
MTLNDTLFADIEKRRRFLHYILEAYEYRGGTLEEITALAKQEGWQVKKLMLSNDDAAHGADRNNVARMPNVKSNISSPGNAIYMNNRKLERK